MTIFKCSGALYFHGVDVRLYFAYACPMHPPQWNPNQRLMDWPDCSLDLVCSCGASVLYPCKLLASKKGNQTFAEVLERLKCKQCRKPPREVYLVAGHFRKFGLGGPPPGWSIPLCCRS